MSDETFNKEKATREAMQRIQAAAEVVQPEPPPFKDFTALKKFQDDVALAEFNAPIRKAGPLPLRVNSLAFLPEDRRAQYVREWDGSFTLSYIHIGDSDSMTEHFEVVAANRLAVLPDGYTLQQLEAEQAAKLNTERTILTELDELARLEREATLAAQRAVLEARQKAEAAAFEARQRRALGLPTELPDDLKEIAGFRI